jgi:hypothetical protein
MKKHDLWDRPDMHDKKIGISEWNLYRFQLSPIG